LISAGERAGPPSTVTKVIYVLLLIIFTSVYGAEAKKVSNFSCIIFNGAAKLIICYIIRFSEALLWKPISPFFLSEAGAAVLFDCYILIPSNETCRVEKKTVFFIFAKSKN
jgi:hypothetical protein